MVFGINPDNTKIRLICTTDADIEKIAVELKEKYWFHHIRTYYNALYDITATCKIYNLDEESELIAKLSKDFKGDLIQTNLEFR